MGSVNIWAPFLVLFLGLGIGVPVAFAMAVAGVFGLWLTLGLSSTLSLLTTAPFSESASHTLSTIPMFILMAEILSQGRITRELFAMASKWLSPIRGGLAMSVIGANGIFGALSGSSVAAVGLLANISVPEMRRYGYSERLALGTVAASGTFSSMIPPSIAMIIFGIITQTSIGRLFAAGLLPGLATLTVYLAITYIWASVSPSSAPRGEKASWADRFSSTRSVLPVIPLIFLVLGGIYAGIITPTEAGAVGAFGALLLTLFMGGLNLRALSIAVMNTVTITSMILLIIVGAGIFGSFLAASRTSAMLITSVTESGFEPWVILATILVLYVVLGTFMSASAIMLLTLPIVFPVVVALGYNPVWFGILVIKTVEIGLATPPLGINVYVTHGIAGGRLEDVFVGSGIYLLGDLLVLALILLMPDLVTGLGDFIFRG